MMPSHRSFRVTVAILIGGGALSVPSVAASTREGSAEDELQIARCIHEAAGGRSWLEKTLWGLRDQEAGWIGAEIQNTNGSHDLGPLQINSWWVPKIAKLVGKPSTHVRHWLRFDPCFNAQAARWIFLSGLAATGDYWAAVGVYHSPTAWRQRRYSASVALHMQRRFGADVFPRPFVIGCETKNNDANRITISPDRIYGFGMLAGASPAASIGRPPHWCANGPDNESGLSNPPSKKPA